MGNRTSHVEVNTLATVAAIKQPILHPWGYMDGTRAKIEKIFSSLEWRNLLAHRLSCAVQVPTVTFDGMGHVGEDSRWEVFYTMARCLEEMFPQL